ncbi:MAG TPA: bifunctional riboflavin kinase/FAD synthetase [Caldisericia bacterium]|mgnify:CR=1 FL=1|nr:bifunctional riboflavin kinase/FAD synthetase [Caldisericia bacterium]HPF48133.1 bifunctional riboflavin kinase/FAD synthetase [Caldisericia bacterium]HPI83930.1 bifunctional riboflavin kinase/FAD synthetase [Caldisericia bacterium]HPQ92586.1 bifunctional riboflavin kinase/FAD synthetase [Caldisericia bacterium]HRV74316.1 bifunctional riboflavin kinase/FAD synthetase [Caldisericia bacterium]
MTAIWKGNPINLDGVVKNCCYMIGYFDGVHIGHLELIKATIKKAKEFDTCTGAFTFGGLLYTKSIPTRGLLTTSEEREHQLESGGIDNVLMVNFVDSLRDMSPRDFVNIILKDALQAKAVLVGPGFKFGKSGAATSEDLMMLCGDAGIECVIIPSVEFEGSPISSTRIRKNLLFSGNVSRAASMLGRNYSLSGRVVTGAGIGKTLGFPTANIDVPDENKLIPAEGVYACFVRLEGKTYQSVVSIGTRPTFHDNQRVIEAHLLDFEGNLYNMDIGIEFVDRLREQKRFDERDALKAQIGQDVKRARGILGGHNNE